MLCVRGVPKLTSGYATVWLTVNNKIFKFPPHLDPFVQENYLYQLSSAYLNQTTQKWYIWACFETSGKRFCKLQEAIWLPVIKKICKFLPHLEPFGQKNYLCAISSGYPNYPIQKWYIWTSFQNSRKRFRKLQEAIWLTVINEIFKFLPHLDPFGQKNYLCALSSGYPNYPIQKWYIWTSFQTSRKRFRKLQEAIWLTLINEIFKFPTHLDTFVQETTCMNSPQSIWITQLKNDIFGLVSRLLERDFVNYRKPYG